MRYDVQPVFLNIIPEILDFGKAPVQRHRRFEMFDSSKAMKLEATVQSLQWSARHAVLWVDAPKVGGYDARVWSLELPTGPAGLAKTGCSRTSVNAGDKLVVEIDPRRAGRRAGQFKRATFVESGQVPNIGALPGGEPPK